MEAYGTYFCIIGDEFTKDRKLLLNLLLLKQNRYNQLYEDFVWIDVYLMSILI